MGIIEVVRIAALLLILALAGCNRGQQNNDAVRQGVIEYLQKVGMNVNAMDISISGVKYDGNKADASVAMSVKGTPGTQMTMGYHLEQKDNKWVVIGKQDTSQHGAGAAGGTANPHAGGAAAPGGENPHAGGAMPGGENPHAGGAPGAPAGGGKMPSPEDLPPAGKKK